MLPNIGGLGYLKRWALCSEIHGTLFYAAPVWREILNHQKYRSLLMSVQRVALIRVSSAYRTVSASAVQVVAGCPPIDIMIKEICFLYMVEEKQADIRRMARSRSLRNWQCRWRDEETTALWTRKLIPSVSDWVECGHSRTNYYFIQFLTGHGSFGTLTKKIGKRQNDRCQVCSTQDLPEQVFYVCRRRKTERSDLM